MRALVSPELKQFDMRRVMRLPAILQDLPTFAEVFSIVLRSFSWREHLHRQTGAILPGGYFTVTKAASASRVASLQSKDLAFRGRI